MPGKPRKSPLLAFLAAAIALLLAGGTALAAVTVYRNNFSSRTEAKELRHAEGKHCSKRWRKGAKALRILVERGREVCGYRPPVQGDAPGPDHRLQVAAKLLKHTPRGVRDGAYVGVLVRVAKDESYELRVFPKRHHFELRRAPTGTGFPVSGDSSAIKGTAKQNLVRIEATGNTVIGRVNGNKLAEVTDSNAGEVSGRKLEVTIGHRRKSSKPVSFVLDSLKVQVPNP